MYLFCGMYFMFRIQETNAKSNVMSFLLFFSKSFIVMSFIIRSLFWVHIQTCHLLVKPHSITVLEYSRIIFLELFVPLTFWCFLHAALLKMSWPHMWKLSLYKSLTSLINSIPRLLTFIYIIVNAIIFISLFLSCPLLKHRNGTHFMCWFISRKFVEFTN